MASGSRALQVIFELVPIMDGPLLAVDVPVFLDQISKTLKILKPLSARLDNLKYRYADGKFSVNSEEIIEDDAVNELIKVLNNDRSFWLHTRLSAIPSGIITEFLTLISDDKNRFVIFWQFDIEVFALLNSNCDEVATPLIAKTFSFGNIINGNRYVTHLNELGQAFSSESITSNCNMISDIFIETNGMFNILFKMSFYNTERGAYDFKRCKFQFAAASVTEILTSLRNRGIEFYFDLAFPPKLYLGGGADEEPSDEYTNRWKSNDLISKETIGRCNTLMIKLDFSESIGLTSLLTKMYSDFFVRKKPIIFSPILKYNIDYPDGLFANSFPFEVRYALECIFSLSNAIKDDLYINNTKTDFYNLIQQKLDEGRETILTEVLYQLYQEYVDREVHNAYKSFVCLFDELDERSLTGHNRITPLVKKIVLTPMKTIYLPPTPTRNKIMFENVKISQMIIVYFRDDDRNHTSCDTYNNEREIEESDFNRALCDVQFRKNFFEEIIQKRLFKENGLILAQPLKYLGTSVTKIFSYGILVQAKESD